MNDGDRCERPAYGNESSAAGRLAPRLKYMHDEIVDRHSLDAVVAAGIGGVNRAMRPDAVIDRTGREPRAQQLRSVNDPILVVEKTWQARISRATSRHSQITRRRHG